VPARGEEESWDVVYYRQADGQTPALDFLANYLAFGRTVGSCRRTA